ncbi:MAG: propionyl-CoA synthetase [Comamonas sp. SCN 65-56]|uniref:propionyl-CoA synthetase n=1 Tax=Comamonas sp. SCN 65-56 TaxID=1660095 RepID=UPI00086CE161|nr:propionyl-CoA synthetase [Comamonas sp. SCN 65-56]ODS93954.1 MAG: propionyl-CoA synthetase [Comamonas sp. SCN 65-56]
MSALGSGNYAKTRAAAQSDPQGFWAGVAEGIAWDKRWDTVIDDSRKPFYRWFAGGVLNTCYNCVDRHVEGGRGDQLALIYDSPLAGAQRKFTYRQLQDEVARCAGVLRDMGVGKGDRVVIYMPMVAEAAIAMLACARIGAVHSVVFGGFAAPELAKRIVDAKPKVMMSASCGLLPGKAVPYKPLLDEALEIAGAPATPCLILQRPELHCDMVAGRDVEWNDAVAKAQPADCVPLAATDPLYVIYTSGTTGKPKGVVRDNGGHAVALRWSMDAVFGVKPGDVYWAGSDVGWVVGHSYIVYGPLLQGCTTILYEGKPVGTPDAGAFWRVCAEHGVNVFFTAPTAFRAIKKEDPNGELVKKYDLSKFRTLFLAGERGDPDTIEWAQNILGVPVIDNWWQTELGWPAISNCMGLEYLPVHPGSPTKPVPGFDIRILDEEGREKEPGEIGSLVIKLPMPPGTLYTLWNNEHGYEETYLSRYPGYYLSGDAGYIDAEGYGWVMSRIDDIINVAGHRLSTGQMEEILASHPDVAEAAVVGVADALKGQVPLGLVVLKMGVKHTDEEICKDLVARVRAQLGAVADFKSVHVVARLPKTRSGKVLRVTIRTMADGGEVKIPATIEDDAVLPEIQEALSALGYPRKS